MKLRLIFLTVLTMFVSCVTEPLEGDFVTKKDPVEDPNTEQQVPEKPNGEPNTPKPEGKPVTKPEPAPVPPKPVTKPVPVPSKPVPKPTTPPVVNNPVVDSNTSEAQEMLKLVNQLRKNAGVKPVVLNNALNTAAFKHSKDMNDNRYFDHRGKDGSSFSQRTKRENYQGFATGENIAQAFGTEQVFGLWRDSPGHRQNMLNPNVNEMGIGKSGNYWTQIFGQKR
ncbi:CAP domain-containing protein [Aquimarina agarilytica]|uniref:CAP domain-containing protein n=1 Tax=Aquimarina agarilytica TaxID=1087449 RepID=UPI001E4353FD|nr:CAP domain-containing protein [Aquimarina agarilytica]